MSENCLDITLPFVEKASAQGIPIQIFGGIGTAAIAEGSTSYDLLNREMATAERLFIERLRPNGSPKDLDVQVLSTDQDKVQEVEAIGEETVGNQLEVNVFGLHTFSEIEDMVEHPFSRVALMTALSDRYVVGEFTGADEDTFFKAVFPFGVATQQSALETWYVVNGKDTPVPVPHPAMMILNNLTRSIAGLRKKYDQKTLTMTDNISADNPELLEWMVDGPGRPQMELAGVLRSLGWLGLARTAPEIRLSAETDLTITPPDPDELIDHPAFLMGDASRPAQRAAMALARTKSAAVVGPVERHLQDWWERHNFERLFSNAVRNK